MGHEFPHDPNFRCQSVEERAEIRRRRRAEEAAMIARGEHVPTFTEACEAFIAAMSRTATALRGLRGLRIELQDRPNCPPSE